ncbi:GH36-type glycosyl hydrolase domain-containing protein [Peristeroidobacter agariperforans]|uniref:GH36-type glycosyl hydrolase domain-containing protein n=1 Tax=Peristeroidobacter agariperforans TaxID=268404 RepID=UPI00101B9D24|nr:glucoamylase family protein [Peristeroidobacter agariperforans]
MKSFLSRLPRWQRPTPPWNSSAIIREELFSITRLEQHAESLAQSQPVTTQPQRRRSLNARLSNNEAVLLGAYRTITLAASKGGSITPAGEWLVDNYHVIEQQIRKIHSDLPPSFYRQLPKLADGPFTGYPRVFGMAWACVAHSDSRFDLDALIRFVRAYQVVQPLTIGELWAMAITLRIVLVENLRRAAERIVSGRAEREQADRVADRLLGVNGLTIDRQALFRYFQKHGELPASFVVQVVKRLRDQDPRVTPALQWLEEQLIAQGTTSDQMVYDEHQRQGATNVTVRNIITSMRLISDVNWAEFFEAVSLVEAALCRQTDLAQMDFATRNLYRSAIETLSRRSACSELEITHALIAATQSIAASDPDEPRKRDPGYHLLGRGRRSFEVVVGYRPPLSHWPRALSDAVGPMGFILSVLLLAALIISIPLAALAAQGIARAHLLVCALLGMIPAIDLSVALVNRAVTRGFGATMLPGLSLRKGIPASMRTMIVVPALLTTREAIEALLERLEVHYLASSHGELHLALLLDWTDAATEHTADDAALLQIAADGIARLNRVHEAPSQGARFYALHRHRIWSESQQHWMGWERKRGKLHELNQLLRGAVDTTFIAADTRMPLVPPDVRYVITLDADTRLPREAVRRLVGKLAHPLNHARFDATAGRVVEGYGVLQPRVTPSLPIGREGSLFQRTFSSMTGIDPYGAAVSDVYQDLFGEGSYAGKGIYDVDAFEAALASRVPTGSLLSHDLFEGTFARAALASDIEVIEEFPARYDVAAARNHRWVRGDWQLLPWLFGRPDAAGRGTGSLPLLGQWKMLDNLRRSLSAPTALLALLTGWLLPLHAASIWTAFVLTAIALPALLPVLAAVVPRRGVIARSHLTAWSQDVALACTQIGLLITFLPHQAWVMVDAISRTLYRLAISRRNLLEWVTAAQSQLASQPGLAGIYRRMSASVLAALSAMALVAFGKFEALWVALPFVLLWSAAPAIARRISESPLVAGRVPVSDVDRRGLRLVARRTWRYFETFVSATDHMLPPDNFQEDPQPVVAHRTSPTNMGLYLLCAVSARDFGWTGTLESIERLETTLATMQRLQRFRGHFYNWYDTRDLRPLEPQYVSSVDSGNLAAHLATVANACLEWIRVPIDTAAHFEGIVDAIHLTRDALLKLPDEHRTQALTRRQLAESLSELSKALDRKTPPADITTALVHADTQATILSDGARALASEHDALAYQDLLFWAEATQRSIKSWQRDMQAADNGDQNIPGRLLALAATARTLALAMEFGFLLDSERKLLAIGYRVPDGALDESCYDLLASEARLASFFSIAKNDVPASHWFRLGREVTPVGRGAALISWSGSMFEYLMPSLVMRAPAGSLLEQTSRLIVRRQIGYGASLDIPWGVSESAYGARDLELTYQYSNFGVPGLGLKRGLSESLVIAPYATGLAAMVDPKAAMQNYARLASVGALGAYGFYEALDYTRSRLPEGTDVVIVKAFMAHHQGMTIVAAANVLFDGRMRARFHSDAMVQAAELLLHERTPRDVSVAHPRAEEVKGAARSDDQQPTLRRLHTAHSAAPQTHILSNGRYAAMLSAAGSGYSRWGEIGITRLQEDATRDDSGSYVFVRDAASGAVWSAGFQPSGVEPDSYEVTFSEDRAEFVRVDTTVTTTLEVVVSPEDNAEVRRVSIANTGSSAIDLDVTSYSELALAPPAADTAHPAFSKLFVQTEFATNLGVLLATRRRRASTEPEIWAAHHVAVEGTILGTLEYETDRARFLGRGREVHEPVAVMDGRPLSNTVGTVLDPVFALRQRVRIQPGAMARLSFWTCVSSTRASVLDLFDKHRDANAFSRAATLAWTQAQVQLHHLGITAEEAHLFQRVAGHVLFADASLRPSSTAIQRGACTRPALWAHGISGDVPIVLLRIEHMEDMAIARQLLQAHEYWRLKQLAVDLVILNERAASYVQDLQIALEGMVRTRQSQPQLHVDSTKGSIFVLRTDLVSAETRATLSSVARAVFIGARGALADQLHRRAGPADVPAGVRRPRLSNSPRTNVSTPPLEFFNGMGGFADDGREYVVTLDAGQTTPAPWINVIANPYFGFQTSADGGGYTWSVNSRENQLTQWCNDPVTDRPGEVLYVRDEDTGALWNPTLAPARDEGGPYHVRHGRGYSVFEHRAHEIELDLLMYVPLEDSIKISRLRIRNTSRRNRHLSVTAYVEWVLGTSRAASAPFVVTEMDAQTGAMFARNPWNSQFASRVAFADLAGRQTQWTGDRCEFLGRHGTLEQPAALGVIPQLSGRVGAGLDPCCALQTSIAVEPDECIEIVFLLGEAASATDARSLLKHYRNADLGAVLTHVKDFWDEALGTVRVKTPDRSMDLMLNGWLLYQTLVCRIWARSAFYQASGAYGFRDQLQDGMAIVTSQPALTREHLLRAAGRQFPEGDVQHWWLPPAGQGVRTRISDDRVWLAYAAVHYLTRTGDTAILDESIAYLEGGALAPGQHDAYFQPNVSDTVATFFEHCARALDDSLALGAHGLPLMGTGDWNDGMNRVGEKGRGESVWLGWFLHATLCALAPFAIARREIARAERWLAHATTLRESLEREAWDGNWYRRGYYDDGTPLGSAASDECRIDSIAQSWSVISGAADATRAARAMAAVNEHLIRPDDGLALLFTPPFDRTALDPGYVKGYPPGIRENGGQYTHAAAWSVIAFARLGQGNEAAALFALLNPINRTSTRTAVRRYKVEPYVVAADVYSVAPHVGRGGWTWYTGSAGWLYRAGIEAILGLHVQGTQLLLTPCIPKEWPRFDVAFRYRSARYDIAVVNPDGVCQGVAAVTLDGLALPSGEPRIQLLDDGTLHRVELILGSAEVAHVQ